MKKYLLLALFCIAISSFSFGQLNIIDASGKVVNNDTVLVLGNTTDEMEVVFNVINTGLDSVTVYTRRDSISTPTILDSSHVFRWDNTFCWGLCYAYGTTSEISEGGEVLSRGGTSGDTSFSAFDGYYKGYGQVGAAFIRYSFFPAKNFADSSWVMVKYDATPAGVQGMAGMNSSFSAYPNPASNSISFNYKLANGVQAANLKIYNLLGECIQTMALSTSQSKTNLDVQSMPSGIYICEIQSQGSQPVCQKVVVSH
jgi:hypothetical protein